MKNILSWIDYFKTKSIIHILIIDIYYANSKILVKFAHKICADSYYLYVFKISIGKEKKLTKIELFEKYFELN